MLTYNLDQFKGKPLYEALYMCIRNDILSGTIGINEKLPSKRSLASHMNISVTTVENAYAQLITEGYIRAEHGRGFFVNKMDLASDSSSMQILTDDDRETLDIPSPDPEPEYVIDFKSNQTALNMFPMATWARIMRNILSYQDIKLLETVPYNGVKALRTAIAEHLHAFRNMNVDPEQIIIGAGTEYLYSRLLTLFGRDSIIAMEDPGYKKFADISKARGILANYVPIDSEGMRIDRVLAGKANILHVSPANHFPTGTVMSVSRRMDLLDWARRRPERYIIEDDYDSELRYSGKPIPTMYSIDTSQKVIYINTFSKSLVPSIRISYMVLPPLLLSRYRETLSFYSCTVSSFEQLTLAHFISQGYFERHINRLKQHYKENRDLLMEAISKSPLSLIARIKEANAGTHFLLSVNTYMSDAQIRDAAAVNKINLAMLSDYEYELSLRNTRTLVINYAGLDKDKIDTAVGILEKIFETDIKKYQSDAVPSGGLK